MRSGFTSRLHSHRSVLCLIVLVVLSSLAASNRLMAEEKLRIWLVLNEPSAEGHPLNAMEAFDAFVEQWAKQGIDLRHLRHRAEQRPEFVWSLLGQQNVLARIAEFRTQAPGSPTIEAHFFDWSEYGEIVRAHAEHLRPDLLQVPTTWCSSLAAEFKILAPIPAPVAERIQAEDEPASIRPCLVYGAPPLFGLPWLIDVRLLYFWRDDLPTLANDLRDSNNAREAFWHALRLGKPDRTYPRFAIPTSGDWELLHNIALLVWGQGGELISTRHWLWWHSNTPVMEEPGLRGLIFIRTLMQQGLISLPEKTRQDLDELFVEHRLSSVVSGPWLITQLKNRLNKTGRKWDELVGLSLPPFYESAERAVTFSGGSVLSITGIRPKMTGPALRLALYLSRERPSLDWIQNAGLIPAAKPLRGDPPRENRNAVENNGRTGCGTYYDCLGASSASLEAGRVIETAIHVGRGYPNIPQWWDLEVPGSLGPVRHLWQEVATLQPEDQLRADLDRIAADWDSALGNEGHLATWAVGLISLAMMGALLWWWFRPMGWGASVLNRRTPSAGLDSPPDLPAPGDPSEGPLGAGLRMARGRAGHTQAEAARRTGIAVDALSDIEKGIRKPQAKNEQIIRAYIRDPTNFTRTGHQGIDKKSQ